MGFEQAGREEQGSKKISEPDSYDVNFEARQNLQILVMQKFISLHPEWEQREAKFRWTEGKCALQFDEYVREHPEIIQKFQEDPDEAVEKILHHLGEE
ncbi:MAG TPA: hypothetical protein VFM02_01115 [Candidatus Paceibacterota bacterium]|nr:hypothetical protein [Candidatus Paceibacterota bacterium]